MTKRASCALIAIVGLLLAAAGLFWFGGEVLQSLRELHGH